MTPNRRTRTVGPHELELTNNRVRQHTSPEDYWRPSTRGECQNGPRPCPYAGCRYHLYLDVARRNRADSRSLVFNFPGKEVHDLEETCALDVAEKGGVTLEHVGSLMSVTRERARQVEEGAIEKVFTRLGRKLGAEEMTRG